MESSTREGGADIAFLETIRCILVFPFDPVEYSALPTDPGCDSKEERSSGEIDSLPDSSLLIVDHEGFRVYSCISIAVFDSVCGINELDSPLRT